ncbi:MAG: hypothetical protein D6722_20355, partial [Bacteroidetes bacterium]
MMHNRLVSATLAYSLALLTVSLFLPYSIYGQGNWQSQAEAEVMAATQVGKLLELSQAAATRA